MFERAAKTVYFRHFPKHGMRVVFATEDARISALVVGKMIVRDINWREAEKKFVQAGFKVADVMLNDVAEELPREVAAHPQRQLSLM
jgi:hypothetical protein